MTSRLGDGRRYEERLHALAGRLPGRPWQRAGLAVLLYAVLVSPYLWSRFSAGTRQWFVDLLVYREAGQTVLRGGHDLYSFSTPVLALPFTYPPFPAVLSAPLAWAPPLVDAIGWTVSVAVLVWGVTAVVFRPVLARTGRGRLFLLAALAAGMTWLLPVRDVVKFGQVDMIMVALVLADCLAVRPRWPRGALVGLATAVKLTPGLFIPYLWLTGRRREAYVAAGSFAVAELLAAAVVPGASWRFWTYTLFHSDRLGSNSGTSNQSLRGMLLRLHAAPHLTSALWLLLVIVALVVGLWRAVRASRAGDEVAAVALTGLLSVLVSPVSWIHHMVWLVLVVAVVADDFRDRRRVVGALAVVAYFSLRLPWYGNTLSLGHSGLYPARLLQDSFGLAALGILCTLPWRTPVAGRRGTVRPAGRHGRAGPESVGPVAGGSGLRGAASPGG